MTLSTPSAPAQLLFIDRPIDAVLWDLDGTLIDTAPDFIRIIKLLCQQEGVNPPTDAAIREQVSEGARAMVKLIFPDWSIDDPRLLAYRDTFLTTYQSKLAVDSNLFAGLNDFLHSLEAQQIPWGIVTNKPRHLAKQLLQELGLSQRCATLVCPDDVTYSKPHPEPMLLAAAEINVACERIVYIGDHPRDIQAGIAANMPTLLAAYGYISAALQADLASWNADAIIEKSTDINQVFSWQPR